MMLRRPQTSTASSSRCQIFAPLFSHEGKNTINFIIWTHFMHYEECLRVSSDLPIASCSLLRQPPPSPRSTQLLELPIISETSLDDPLGRVREKGSWLLPMGDCFHHFRPPGHLALFPRVGSEHSFLDPLKPDASNP